MSHLDARAVEEIVRGTFRDSIEVKSLCFCVPSDRAPCIQVAHIAAWHAICAVVEQELFGI